MGTAESLMPFVDDIALSVADPGLGLYLFWPLVDHCLAGYHFADVLYCQPFSSFFVLKAHIFVQFVALLFVPVDVLVDVLATHSGCCILTLNLRFTTINTLLLSVDYLILRLL